MARMPGKQKPRVYNLSWFSKLPGSKDNPAPFVRHETSTISAQNPIGVIILYPALATPEILVGDTDQLEMLLLTTSEYKEEKLRERILNQLKISPDLDAAKSCADRALFTDVSGNDVGTAADRVIDVKKIPFGKGQLIATLSGRFSGYLDNRAFKIFSDAGYKTLYSVGMSSKVLEGAMGSSSLSAMGEPQDLLINKLLDKRSPWAKHKEDKKYYSFPVADDVDYTKFDLSNPVQSYHPVFHYHSRDLNYANIAHLTDIHMAARQQVLGTTKARVIDDWDKGFDTNLPDSPYIGTLINSCSKDMLQILGALGQSAADILLIGGDLVDCLRSVYPSAPVVNKVKDGTPSKVWSVVALDGSYQDHYKDAVNMIGFYSVLVNYCRTHKMPAYAVTGNHDCYFLPYGISPRIGRWKAETRANEGIPNDHNLTFYEAILAFGETYRVLKHMPSLSSPFEKDWLDWFYMVFTPFTDFAVELPNQYLVGLGWGETEKVIDFPKTGHGFGHLPRPKDPVSDEQVTLLENAIAKKKKVILMTHFTFVSYADSIPVNEGATGHTTAIADYTVYNMGTFQENRQKILGDHCSTARDIQIILTGHSHRRALYLLDKPDSSSSIRTLHFDFDDFSKVKANYASIVEPAIIVSDSGGTIPRYNFDGEFEAWGSDPPSGTLIRMDPNSGAVHSITAVRTELCRPRAVVGIDYMDIQEKEDAITMFQTIDFDDGDEKAGKITELTFAIQLHDELSKRDFLIDNLVFYTKWLPDKLFRRIFVGPGKDRSFAIQGDDDMETFREYIVKNKSRGNFVSMRFKGLHARMPRRDFNTTWCWEFQVKRETLGSRAYYKILRDKQRAEKPDFDWRRTYITNGRYK